jgi:hypothetical protein
MCRFQLKRETAVTKEKNNRKKNLIEKYELLPVIAKTRGQRFRISSDIEQIDWRIKYCNEIFNSTFHV